MDIFSHFLPGYLVVFLWVSHPSTVQRKQVLRQVSEKELSAGSSRFYLCILGVGFRACVKEWMNCFLLGIVFSHFFHSRKLLIFSGRLSFLGYLDYSYCILPLKYGSTGLDRHLGRGCAESLLGSGEPKPRFIPTCGWTSYLHSLMSRKDTRRKGDSFLSDFDSISVCRLMGDEMFLQIALSEKNVSLRYFEVRIKLSSWL